MASQGSSGLNLPQLKCEDLVNALTPILEDLEKLTGEPDEESRELLALIKNEPSPDEDMDENSSPNPPATDKEPKGVKKKATTGPQAAKQHRPVPPPTAADDTGSTDPDISQLLDVIDTKITRLEKMYDEASPEVMHMLSELLGENLNMNSDPGSGHHDLLQAPK